MQLDISFRGTSGRNNDQPGQGSGHVGGVSKGPAPSQPRESGVFAGARNSRQSIEVLEARLAPVPQGKGPAVMVTIGRRMALPGSIPHAAKPFAPVLPADQGVASFDAKRRPTTQNRVGRDLRQARVVASTQFVLQMQEPSKAAKLEKTLATTQELQAECRQVIAEYPHLRQAVNGILSNRTQVLSELSEGIIKAHRRQEKIQAQAAAVMESTSPVQGGKVDGLKPSAAKPTPQVAQVPLLMPQPRRPIHVGKLQAQAERPGKVQGRRSDTEKQSRWSASTVASAVDGDNAGGGS